MNSPITPPMRNIHRMATKRPPSSILYLWQSSAKGEACSIPRVLQSGPRGNNFRKIRNFIESTIYSSSIASLLSSTSPIDRGGLLFQDILSDHGELSNHSIRPPPPPFSRGGATSDFRDAYTCIGAAQAAFCFMHSEYFCIYCIMLPSSVY